jgi:hypothetical protein
MLQQLNETFVTRGKITESDRTKLPKGVLCRVSYNICNLGKLNQNNRIYSREVWENVLKNKSIQDKIQNRVLFGHAEHPSTSQSDLQLTSHVITKMWIDEAAGCVMQEMDVLDTPTGRIVNTLLEAGCAAGVSTRAEGDLEEAVDEATGQKYLKVIPEKYNYLTTDFTADPSTYGTKPLNLVREIKNVLSSASLTKGEKAFATTLLEAIEKVDKGTKESIVPDDEDSEEKKIEKLTEKEEAGKTKYYYSVDVIDSLNKKTTTKEGKIDISFFNYLIKNGIEKEDWPEGLSDAQDALLGEMTFWFMHDISNVKKALNNLKAGKPYAIYADDFEEGLGYSYAVGLGRSSEEAKQAKSDLSISKTNDIEESKKKLTEGTIEQFIEAELIKAGVLAKCMGMSGKIKEIKEHTVTIAFDNGAEATITGPTPVSVGPEGMVLIPNIAPIEQPLQAAVEPLNEPPMDTPSDLPVTPETEGGESDVLTPEEEEEAIDRGEELKAALEDDVITDEEHEAMETPEEEEAEHAPGGYEEGEEEEEGEVPTEDEEEEKEEVEESKVNEGSEPGDIKKGDIVIFNMFDSDSVYSDKDLRDELGKEEYLIWKKHNKQKATVVDMVDDIAAFLEFEDGAKTDPVSIAHLTKTQVEESKDTKALYTKKGLTPPQGKGIHKKKFHEMATAIAAKMKKEGKGEKEAKKSGYAISMSKLGKKGAVKAGHRSNESKVNERTTWYDLGVQKSLSSTLRPSDFKVKEIHSKKTFPVLSFDAKTVTIQVEDGKKATLYAGDDFVYRPKYILLTKDGEKVSLKIRPNESKLVFESYEDMVNYLKNEFTKLSPEQTAKLSSIFPTAALNESKGNTTNEVRTLKLKEAATRAESEKALEMLTEAEKEIETIKQSAMIESKVLSSKLQEAKTTESKEVEGLRKLLEEKTKALNEFKSKVNEQTNKLTEAKTTYDSKVKELEEKFQSKIIKEYIDMKANGASLRLPSNSRALLEKCSSIKEVDKVFEEVRDALRRGALLPDGVNGIKVQLTEKAKDPVQVQIDASIGAAMSGM